MWKVKADMSEEAEEEGRGAVRRGAEILLARGKDTNR